MKVYLAADSAGYYESASQFSREFKHYFGAKPGGDDAGNAGGVEKRASDE